MIGVPVSARDKSNTRESIRFDHAPADAVVRFLGPAVLCRQRIRQIRIENHPQPIMLHQIPALPKPPQIEPARLTRRAVDVGQQYIITLQRLDQPVISSRTMRTPATIFASLPRAAHLAV